MKPLPRACLVLALLAAQSGCGLAGTQEVTHLVFELKSDRGAVTYTPPGHCTQPGYRLVLRPGEGVTVSLQDSEHLEIEVAVGATFQFTSATAGAALRPGDTTLDVPLPTAWFYPQSNRRITSTAADALLAGPAPGTPTQPPSPNQKTYYETSIRYDVDLQLRRVLARPDVAALTLRLPDAIVDGRRVAMPAIEIVKRSLTYRQDACLR